MSKVYVYCEKNKCNGLTITSDNDIIKFNLDSKYDDTNKSELYFIYDILKYGIPECIYTSNVYIKNVLSEWIHIWASENFEYELVKEVDNTTIKGMRPNSDILILIHKLIKNTSLKIYCFAINDIINVLKK